MVSLKLNFFSWKSSAVEMNIFATSARTTVGVSVGERRGWRVGSDESGV